MSRLCADFDPGVFGLRIDGYLLLNVLLDLRVIRFSATSHPEGKREAQQYR
jgi:hypothetical protein